MLRSAIILCIMAFTFSASFAQTEYKSKKEGWEVEVAKAVEISHKTGKPIMANFTGTDWCGWCIKLDRAVFSKPEFKAWAKDNVVLLELDFPKRSKLPQNIAKQNNEMQRAFQVRGFPSVWVFDAVKDAEGNGLTIQKIGSTGYANNVGEFTSTVNKIIQNRSK